MKMKEFKNESEQLFVRSQLFQTSMQQWLLDEPASNLCSNDYQPQIIKV